VQELRGPGYTAEAPGGWELSRPPRTIAADNPDGPESVSVAQFRLARRFRPSLWDAAVVELNDVAARLAERIGPEAVVGRSGQTTIAGRRARTYEIDYTREGERLVDKVAFILEGRREFQLTCRIRVDGADAGTEACDRLRSSFRLT
jgi:hypothetical protein